MGFPIENFESHLPSQMDFCGAGRSGANYKNPNIARQIVQYVGQKNKIAFIGRQVHIAKERILQGR